MEETILRYHSPLGALECVFRGEVLVSLLIGRSRKPSSPGSGQARGRERLSAAACRLVSQLDAYFSGGTEPFDLPVEFTEGTEFEKKVWLALRLIPRGEIRSYQWLAARVGRPAAARAVGQALGKNPLPIILPCHRIVRSDGGLGGFSCGVDVKEKLLELEGAVPGSLASSRRRGRARRRPA